MERVWWVYSRRAKVFQKSGLNAIERAETVRARGGPRGGGFGGAELVFWGFV